MQFFRQFSPIARFGRPVAARLVPLGRDAFPVLVA